MSASKPAGTRCSKTRAAPPSPDKHRPPLKSTPLFEACILAGGLSSRMGQDKPRLRLGGKSLLAHVRRVAKDANLPVRVIRADLVPRCGPLGGVFTALKTTRADAVLFLSCDMPFITSRLLAQVVSRLKPAGSAVFTKHKKWGFPFLIRRDALQQVETLLFEREFSIHALATRLQAVPFNIRSDPARTLFNLNTPNEYVAARKLAKRLLSRDCKRATRAAGSARC